MSYNLSHLWKYLCEASFKWILVLSSVLSERVLENVLVLEYWFLSVHFRLRVKCNLSFMQTRKLCLSFAHKSISDGYPTKCHNVLAEYFRPFKNNYMLTVSLQQSGIHIFSTLGPFTIDYTVYCDSFPVTSKCIGLSVFIIRTINIAGVVLMTDPQWDTVFYVFIGVVIYEMEYTNWKEVHTFLRLSIY